MVGALVVGLARAGCGWQRAGLRWGEGGGNALFGPVGPAIWRFVRFAYGAFDSIHISSVINVSGSALQSRTDSVSLDLRGTDMGLTCDGVGTPVELTSS